MEYLLHTGYIQLYIIDDRVFEVAHAAAAAGRRHGVTVTVLRLAVTVTARHWPVS